MRLMTMATRRKRVGTLARVSAWIGRRQRELSDRVHAAADEHARQHGWEVTKGTGRFGFGTRTYRDPHFDSRRRGAAATGPDELVYGTDERGQLGKVPLRSTQTCAPAGTRAQAAGPGRSNVRHQASDHEAGREAEE